MTKNKRRAFVLISAILLLIYFVLPSFIMTNEAKSLGSLSVYGDYVGGAGTILSLATILFLIYESNQKEKEHHNDLEIERKKHDQLIKKHDSLINEYQKSVSVQREDLKLSKMVAEFSSLASLESSSKDPKSRLNNTALGHLLRIRQSELLKLYVKKITPKHTIKRSTFGPIVFDTSRKPPKQPSSRLDVSNPANLNVKIESIDCSKNNIIPDENLKVIVFNKEGLENLKEGDYFVITVEFSTEELIGYKFTQNIKYTKNTKEVHDTQGNSSNNWTIDDSEDTKIN